MSQTSRERLKTTVYDGLVTRIRKSIDIGDLKPGALIGSEHELAREAGISRISVRRATDALMREGLIERKPGKGLFVRSKERSTSTVQVIVPDLRFDQCVQIVRGAQEYGAALGLRTQVYDAHSRIDFDIEMLRLLPESSAEGAIVVSWHHPRFAESLYDLKRRDYPFVLVDERLQDIHVPSVLADNYGGGYAAGKHLADAGHQRIAFIGDLAADTIRSRVDGLRDAMTDGGVLFDRTRVFSWDAPLDADWPSIIAGITRRAVDRPDPATAIVFGNDQTAAHGYVALRGLKLSVPDDVSVVGFDDNSLCSWLNPPLSTVRQPSVEMGGRAMQMLIEIMAKHRTPNARREDPTNVLLSTQWVGRDSVGPPKRD